MFIERATGCLENAPYNVQINNRPVAENLKAECLASVPDPRFMNYEKMHAHACGLITLNALM